MNESEMLKHEWEIYIACADDGKGGDITRDGAPLLTYEQWQEGSDPEPEGSFRGI